MTVLLKERDKVLAGKENGAGIICNMRELNADDALDVYERRSPPSRC